MNIKPLKHKEIIDKVATWSTTVLEEALSKKDLLLQVESYVLLEICKPSSQKGNIPFEKILKQLSPEDFIKTSPSLCIEFFILIKKYRLDLYKKEASNIIDVYESILQEIWKDQPTNIKVFFMMTMIRQLKDSLPDFKETFHISISEDSFLLQSKTVIEKNLNDLLIASNYGQQHVQLTATTIEALETILLDYAAKYDLILVSKVLRVLTYAGVKHTYTTDLVSDFLLHNQSIEGYIGHYDPEFIKTKTEHIAQHQRLQITKAIIVSILEYSSDYRYVRDFATHASTLRSSF